VALPFAGIAIHAADAVEHNGIFQKGFGNIFCTQGVAGHENGFSYIAGLCCIVGSTLEFGHGYKILSKMLLEYGYIIPDKAYEFKRRKRLRK
jgi:hypothetical protein